MDHPPPLSALAALDHLDRLGSVAAAAERMRLTPSAVTHKLRALEARLGFALTRRRGRGLSLTPRARRYVEEVRPALALLDRAARRAAGRGLTGGLSIAAAPGFAASWLSPRIAAFADEFPGLELTVSVAGDAAADVSVLFMTPQRARAGDRLLLTPEFFPVAAPRLAAGADAPAGPAALSERRLLHLFDRRDWARWREAHGGAEGRGLIFRDANLMFAAAEAGAGFALGDAITCADAIARGALARAAAETVLSDRSYYLRIDGPGAAADAFAAWLDRTLAPAVRPPA